MATTVVKTIGATGADYTTLQAWEDAAPANLVTADQVWQGQIKDASDSFTGAVLTIAGSTSDSTRYKELTCAAGASFRDNASVRTNPLRYDASKGAAISVTAGYTYAITVTENYARLSGLQMRSTLLTSVALSVSATGVDVNGCIFECTGANGVQFNTGTFRNSIVIQRYGGSYTCVVVADATNCSFVVPSDITATTSGVVVNAYGTSNFKNCAFFGGALVTAGNGTKNFTTCYTDVASPPSGCTTVAYNTTTGSGFENTLDGTHDFRIKSTSTLINVGTTDSTNAALDISKLARPSGAGYDVGAWEYDSGGGGGGATSSPARRAFPFSILQH